MIPALLGSSALMLLIAVVAAYLAITKVTANTERVEHTLRSGAAISHLAALNEQIETARRGQLLAPAPSFVAILQDAQAQFLQEVENVSGLIADNPDQVERIEEIERLGLERRSLLSDVILTPASAAANVRAIGIDRDPGVRVVRRIRTLAAEMSAIETRLLGSRSAEQLHATTRFYLIGGAATFLLILFLGTVIFQALRYNRELDRAQGLLRVSNEGLEAAVAERTAELTRANDEIQRFAYIVSHDLRSPLVNVLGFTAELDQSRTEIRAFLDRLFTEHPELRDEAVWLAADEDVPEALEFIRKSTEKMDRLINSILELSRQGRRQLAPEPLDMITVADTVVSSLHLQAEAAGAQVQVGDIPSFTSDRIAVEQILSNLVENAIKYLQPGRPGMISIGGRRHGRMVEISVTDNGRGIADADRERVFELFRRAGMQDQPGEGIGLANVRALAYRLGGTIALESEAGKGSTFTLSLPDHMTAREELS